MMILRRLALILSAFFSLLFVQMANAEDKNTSSKWEVISDEDNFLSKRMEVSKSNLFAFRGETEAQIPIGKIISVFLDRSKRHEWVDRFENEVELESNKDEKVFVDRVYWIQFKMPVFISDRDYVLEAKGEINHEKREVSVYIKSVEHSRKSVDDCCVRAEAYGTFYRFTSLDNGGTRLEVEVHTDPKAGCLLYWLI